MDLFAKSMTKNLAECILEWKYEKPYDFYNNELTAEEVIERLDGSYSAIVDKNEELIGFCCIGKSAQVPSGIKDGVYEGEFIDIGLGMKPDLVGQGNGLEFGNFIISYVQEKNNVLPIRLTVATFNARAIRLYEKLGFKKKSVFGNPISDFIIMTKEN